MLEYLQSTQAQAIIWVAALLVLCAIGAYVVMQFRNRESGGRNTPNDLLTDFRELKDEGDISRKEFQKIKFVLAPRIQDELKSSDAEGED